MTIKTDLADAVGNLMSIALRLPAGEMKASLISKCAKMQYIVDAYIDDAGGSLPVVQGDGSVSPVPLGNGVAGCC